MNWETLGYTGCEETTIKLVLRTTMSLMAKCWINFLSAHFKNHISGSNLRYLVSDCGNTHCTLKRSTLNYWNIEISCSLCGWNRVHRKLGSQDPWSWGRILIWGHWILQEQWKDILKLLKAICGWWFHEGFSSWFNTFTIGNIMLNRKFWESW